MMRRSEPGTRRRCMFQSIVVGTDGSETAQVAVRSAIEMAKSVGATLQIVSAYEPVNEQRLRSEKKEVPKDMEWMVNPREDVEATLEDAAEEAKGAGLEVETHARQ